MKHIINRLRLYLRDVKRHFLRKIELRALWAKWVFPFEAITLTLSLLTYIYFAKTFGAMSPFLEPYGGDLTSYLLLGILLSGIFYYNFDALREAYQDLLIGHIGLRGQSLSNLDYIILFGSSPSAALIGKMLNGYIRIFLRTAFYLTLGFFLGFSLNPNANYLLALLAIILGLIISIGIGLISASIAIIANIWAGTEPISWFFIVLSDLFSGLYFPIEVIPENLRILSYILPQTYIFKMFRLSLLSPEASITPLIGTSLAYSIIIFSLGAFLFKYSLEVLKEKPHVEL